MLLIFILISSAFGNIVYPNDDYIETEDHWVDITIEGTNCSIFKNGIELVSFLRYTNQSYRIFLDYGLNNISVSCYNNSDLVEDLLIINQTNPFRIIVSGWYGYVISNLPDNFNYSCSIGNQNSITYRFYPMEDLLNCSYTDGNNTNNITINISLYDLNTSYYYNFNYNDSYCYRIFAALSESYIYESFSRSSNNPLYCLGVRELENFNDSIYHLYDYGGLINTIRVNSANNSSIILELNNVNYDIIVNNSDINFIIQSYDRNDLINLIVENSTINIISYDDYFYYNDFHKKLNLELKNSTINFYNFPVLDIDIDGMDSLIFSKKSNFMTNIEYNLEGNHSNHIFINSIVSSSDIELMNLSIKVIGGKLLILNTNITDSNITVIRSNFDIQNSKLINSSVRLYRTDSNIENLHSWGDINLTGVAVYNSNINLADSMICGYSYDIFMINSTYSISNLTCSNTYGLSCNFSCIDESDYVDIEVFVQQDFQDANVLVRFNPYMVPNYECDNGKVGLNNSYLLETYVSGCEGEGIILFRANLTQGLNKFRFYPNIQSDRQYNHINVSLYNRTFVEKLDANNTFEISFWFEPKLLTNGSLNISNSDYLLSFIRDDVGIGAYYNNQKIARITDPGIITVLWSYPNLTILVNREFVTRVNLSQAFELGEYYPEIYSDIMDIKVINSLIYPKSSIIGNIKYPNRVMLDLKLNSTNNKRNRIVYFTLPYNLYREYVGDCRNIIVYSETDALNTYSYCDPEFNYMLIAFNTDLRNGENHFKVNLQDYYTSNKFISESYFNLYDNGIKNDYLILFKYPGGSFYFYTDIPTLNGNYYFSYIQDYYSGYYPNGTYSSYIRTGGLVIGDNYGVLLNPHSLYQLYYRNISNPLYTSDPGYYEILINSSNIVMLDPYKFFVYNLTFPYISTENTIYSYVSAAGNSKIIVIKNPEFQPQLNIKSPNYRLITYQNSQVIFSDFDYIYYVESEKNLFNPTYNESEVVIENKTIYGNLIVEATNVTMKNVKLVGKGGKRDRVYRSLERRSTGCYVGGSNIGYGGSAYLPGYKALNPNVYWNFNQDVESNNPDAYNGGWLVIYGEHVELVNVSGNGYSGGAGGGIIIRSNILSANIINVSGGDSSGCIGAGGGGLIKIESNYSNINDIDIRGGRSSIYNETYESNGGAGVIYIKNLSDNLIIFNNSGKKTYMQSFLPISSIDMLIIDGGAYVESIVDYLEVNNLILTDGILSSPAYPYSKALNIWARNIIINKNGSIDVTLKGDYLQKDEYTDCGLKDRCNRYALFNTTNIYQISGTELFDGYDNYIYSYQNTGGTISIVSDELLLDGELSSTNLPSSSSNSKEGIKAGKIFLDIKNISGTGKIDVGPVRHDCTYPVTKLIGGILWYNITDQDNYNGKIITSINNSSCIRRLWNPFYQPSVIIKSKDNLTLISEEIMNMSSELSYRRAFIVLTNISIFNITENLIINNTIIFLIGRDVNNSRSASILYLNNASFYNTFVRILNPIQIQGNYVRLLNNTTIHNYYKVASYSYTSHNTNYGSYYKAFGIGGGVVFRDFLPNTRAGSYGGMASNIRSFKYYNNLYSNNLTASTLYKIQHPITYGDIRYPTDVGSSGIYRICNWGCSYYSVGTPGGAMILNVSNLALSESQLLAVGISGASGGSILIDAINLSLNNSKVDASSVYPEMRNSIPTTGGGGRIAIHGDNITFDNSSILALGGRYIQDTQYSNDPAYIGAAGTIYIYDRGSNTSRIIVRNHIPTKASSCNLNSNILYPYTPLELDYDVDDIIIINSIVTIKSNSSINRLTLINSSLTHDPYPLSIERGGLDLDIEELISNNSVINVSGCGDVYGLGYRGSGLGASYGGIGYGASSSNLYGHQTNPIYFGSGDSRYSGGGMIKLYVNKIVGDILILDSSGEYYGSGGSILVFVKNLSSNILLRARGGTNAGGGRIAVYRAYYNTSSFLDCDVSGGYSGAGSSGSCFYGNYYYLLPVQLDEGPFEVYNKTDLIIEFYLFNPLNSSFIRYDNATILLIKGNQSENFYFNNTTGQYRLELNFTEVGENNYIIAGRYAENYPIRTLRYKPKVHGFMVNISLNKLIYMPNEIANLSIIIFKYPDNIFYNGMIDLYYKHQYIDTIYVVDGRANYSFNVGPDGGYHAFNIVFDTD